MNLPRISLACLLVGGLVSSAALAGPGGARGGMGGMRGGGGFSGVRSGGFGGMRSGGMSGIRSGGMGGIRTGAIGGMRPGGVNSVHSGGYGGMHGGGFTNHGVGVRGTYPNYYYGNRGCGGTVYPWRGIGHYPVIRNGCYTTRYWPYYSGGFSAYFGSYWPSYASYPYYANAYVPAEYSAPAVVEQAPPPVDEQRPSVVVTQWADEDLKELALNKFSITRGLDRDGNKVVLEITSKSFDHDTGALTKVKFKVRWVDYKVSTGKDGREVVEEKSRNTSVKLKFDELGRFTEYCD